MKSEKLALIVEDSEHDYKLLERAIQKTDQSLELKHFEDGLQAVNYLYETPKADNQKLPALIFLDLNMPGMDGFAFLETLKDDDTFKYIPIIVLSISDNPDDIKRSYECGASGYFKKPPEPEAMNEVVECVLRYWFQCCSLPST